jgi:hypothetical protein
MAKLSRKFFAPQTFRGIVRISDTEVIEMSATGRNKREAEKKLRILFRDRGIITQPDPTVDLLEMENGNGTGYRMRHSTKPHTVYTTERLNFWTHNSEGTSISSQPAGT